jgi:hypothetical protein
MFKTMQAKFSSRCARTGETIQRGDTIIYNTVTRTAMLPSAGSFDGFTGRVNGSGDYVSHVFQFGDGREYYRNKQGRCEDAPCCGCCTI